MKNWENKLSEKLKNRGKRDYTLRDFLRVQDEIIRPTFEEIKSVLSEYVIDGQLGFNDSSLTIKSIDGTQVLKLEFESKGNNEIIVRTNYFDMDPLKENEIKKSEEKIILLSEITNERVGDLFMIAFEPVKFFDE